MIARLRAAASFAQFKKQTIRAVRKVVRWGRRLPPGVRTVLGIPFVLGGLLGFLPVLGFWMIPVGLALIALDVPPLARALDRWLARHERRQRAREDGGDTS